MIFSLLAAGFLVKRLTHLLVAPLFWSDGVRIPAGDYLWIPAFAGMTKGVGMTVRKIIQILDTPDCYKGVH
jgi:hypothetical protein